MRRGIVAFGLAQDVADALVGGGEGFGFGQLGELADGLEAVVEVEQRHRTQLGDGVEMLRRHALVGVVAAQAVEHEVVQIASCASVDACGAGDLDWRFPSSLASNSRRRDRFGGGALAQPANAYVEIEHAFDQGPRQPQRIAPQRERILVAGRLQARGEAAGQRIQPLRNRQHLPSFDGAMSSPAKRGM